MRLESRSSSQTRSDDDDLDAPTWQRRQNEETDASEPLPLEETHEVNEEISEDEFDVPTFLRKRMD